MDKRKTQFETHNRDIFLTIRDQNENIYEDVIEDVLRHINTIHSNNFIADSTERKFTPTLQSMNAVAICMARYGMNNLTLFVEISSPFEEMQVLLDTDMGHGMVPLGAYLQPNWGRRK